MKRSPLRRKTRLRFTPKPIPRDIQHALERRCNGWCEISGCVNRADRPHHRLLRSQGGRDTLDNLLALCFTCHRAVHDNPAWAYDQGYMIRGVDA